MWILSLVKPFTTWLALKELAPYPGRSKFFSLKVILIFKGGNYFHVRCISLGIVSIPLKPIPGYIPSRHTALI